MNEKIKISIIVIVYNVKVYLKKCLESILSQTYKNIEIIIVDDGSTDGCSEICEFYLKADNRIKVIHKKNGGQTSARKAGTAIATGDYIISVDGDDWIEQNRIEVLVTKGIISSKADMIYLSGYRKDFKGNSTLLDTDIPSKTFYDDEVREQVFPLLADVDKAFSRTVESALWMWAIKRKLLQEKQELIDDKVTMAEDLICIIFCLISAKSVKLIKQNGYHYVQRKSSVSYLASVSPEKNRLQLRIWYYQLNRYLNLYNVSKEIEAIVTYLTILVIMIEDYELLLEKNNDYLYPYPEIERDAEIIIYGAGKMGYSLMQYLVKSKKYQVKLWVDQDLDRYALPNYKISSVNDILGIEYDYIVIAVMNADIAKRIKKTLVLRGIPEDKIAVMNPNCIIEKAIPEEIRGEIIHLF